MTSGPLLVKDGWWGSALAAALLFLLWQAALQGAPERCWQWLKRFLR